VIVSEANGGGLVLNTDEQQHYKSNNLGEDDAAERYFYQPVGSPLEFILPKKRE
jgi:hypothetical protein